jgi:hypothetical protein
MDGYEGYEPDIWPVTIMYSRNLGWMAFDAHPEDLDMFVNTNDAHDPHQEWIDAYRDQIGMGHNPVEACEDLMARIGMSHEIIEGEVVDKPRRVGTDMAKRSA